MRITTRGRYALRASLALVRIQNLLSYNKLSGVSEHSHISINQISEEEQISSVFLEQIFFKLRKAGIVTSVRGPGGGFQFAKSPDTITIKEILEAAGEELNVTDCDKNAKTCRVTGKRCSSHAVWEDVTKILDNYFSKMTLSMVMDRNTK
ncbi:MAG: Rrf2 family transcriptional regulator [Treponema sp.]|nr:Rrf2 family transcriptional regulator [Treponema sp.]